MSKPVRVLELRSVFGSGGGPEKTILFGAAQAERDRYCVTVCYLRDRRDKMFAIDKRAAALDIDYVEVLERHSFDPAIWPALRKLVRDRRIDIVHAHDYKTNFYARLLRRAERIVPLTTLHGYTGHSLKERFYYRIDRSLVKSFPRVIVVSSELRDDLIAAGSDPERIVTILNGIDHRAFTRMPGRAATVRQSFGIRNDEIVIGSVGRLERQKRFDLLMNAFAILRTGRPDLRLRLLIAGTGSLRRHLEAERDRLGLGDMVIFTGHIEDVATLHHAFDVFVQASDYEGTPNAVLEAMAMETPVVVTDAGGTADLVRNGIDGLLVGRGNPDTLASAMRQLLADGPGTAERTRSARVRVTAELSFGARMAAVERVYDNLMEASGREASVPVFTQAI